MKGVTVMQASEVRATRARAGRWAGLDGHSPCEELKIHHGPAFLQKVSTAAAVHVATMKLNGPHRASREQGSVSPMAAPRLRMQF